MQIGNYIQYSNVDALGANLTYNGPCKYDVKAIQSNCFHSDTTKNYIAIGNRDDFADVTTVEMTVMFDNISFTQTIYFFSNLLKPNIGFGHYWTQRNKFCLFGDSNKRYIWTTPFNIEANTPYHLRLSYDGTNYTLSVNGQVCYLAQDTESIVDIDDIVRIGIRDPNTTYGLRNASIWNFRCYNASGDLVHHYPMSEGMGKIIYDTVGDKHGIIVNAGNLYSVVWSKFQDDYHYNLTNGYISINGDDIDRFSKTLKIPLKDASSVLVAKDSYQSGINNYTVMAEGAGWNNYTSSTVNLINDSINGNYIKVQVTDGFVSTTKTLNNCHLMTEFNGSLPTTFTSPNLPASYNNFINVNPQIPVQYNLKCKVRCNTHMYDGIDQGVLSFRFTMLQGSVNSFVANMTALTDGEWHEIDITNRINSGGAYTSASTDRTFCCMQFRNVTSNVYVNIDLDIKDIELYRTSNCTYHPPILNGHNGAETKFDFSQGVSDVAEVRNDLLYAYRPGLMETADESLGANGSMRANGWSGAMDTITSAGTITNGLWAIYYNKTGNANNGYIDNYTLTDEELDKMGLSSTGVAAQAVQFTSIGFIISSATQNVALYYRVNLSNLFGKLVFPNVLGWSYKVHFTGWVKKLVEYNANLQLGTGYQNVFQPGGQLLIPESEFTDNEFHYIDKTLSFYYPNYMNTATSTATHYIGLGAYPSGYTSFINPDTGVAYTATEVNHKPTLALAKVKITFEPQEVYFKDGKGFKLMNFNNMALSKYQSKRQNNQTTFNLS